MQIRRVGPSFRDGQERKRFLDARLWGIARLLGVCPAIVRVPLRQELHIHRISMLLERANRSDAVIEVREHGQIIFEDRRRIPSRCLRDPAGRISMGVERQNRSSTLKTKAEGGQLCSLTSKTKAEGEQLGSLTSKTKAEGERLGSLTLKTKAEGEQLGSPTWKTKAEGEQLCPRTAIEIPAP